MNKYIEKFKNTFQYSHPGNKKNFENKIKVFSQDIRYNYEIYLKIVSDFRSAHMNIIAGMIAFLGFINKDSTPSDPNLKYGIIFLLIFIALSIISILFSYYYDSFIFSSKIRYMDGYLKEFIKSKQEVENFEFTKEKAEIINDKLKDYNPPKYKLLLFLLMLLYLSTWIVMLIGLFKIIYYYIGLL